MRRRFPSLSASALLLAAACRPAGGSPAVDPAAEPAGTTVTVENLTTSDATVFVLPRPGERIRLGLATALGTTHLEIPRSVLREPRHLEFLADPVGADGLPVTEAVVVEPGDTVVLRMLP